MDETAVVRFKQGKDAWNAWAQECLVLLDKSSGADVDFSGYCFDEDEHVDFSGYVFPGAVIFQGAVFKSNVTFDKAVFCGGADFVDAWFCGESSFSGAEFKGLTTFECAVFTGKAYFNMAQFWNVSLFSKAIFESDAMFSWGEKSDGLIFYAQFKKTASFDRTLFCGESWFSHVIFESDVHFRDAEFVKWARFDDIVCSSSIQFERSVFCKTPLKSPNGKEGEGGAWFVGAKISGQAWYSDVVFNDNVTFQGALFDNDAIFNGARFLREARFTGMISKRMFTLSRAVFLYAPIFIQTHFDEAPVFDEVDIKEIFTPEWSVPSFFKVNKRKLRVNNLARWRALRRLAVQGHDHEKEREFFAGELWSSPLFGIRFWFGLAYWVFSNHGRSVMRPVVWWGVLTAISVFFYLSQAYPQNSKSGLVPSMAELISLPCKTTPGSSGDSHESNQFVGTTVFREAINLALRNGFIDIERRGDSEIRTFGCLYGIDVVDGGEKGEKMVPIHPRVVSYYMVVQKILSGLFVFLFGASVRNMLRVK